MRLQSDKNIALSRIFSVISAVIVFTVLCSCARQPVKYVDPFICTEGDHGQWLPAALVPFGLVELCPDTWPGSLTADGDFAHSGYDYSDTWIRGFSHLHRGSSGGTTIHDRAGEISILPFSGNKADTFFVNPVVRIEKKTERAKAGYYSVFLTEDNILAELTATARTGFHRYIFYRKHNNRIFIYGGTRSGKTGFSFRQAGDSCLEGSYGNKYFVIEFDAPVSGIKACNGSQVQETKSLENADDGGVICEFGYLEKNTLQIRIGISLSSCESARKNLDAESPDWNFNHLRSGAAELWNNILSAIIVKGAGKEDRKIFYTALYHTCFLPVVQSDVDGVYPGLDQQLHFAGDYIHYDGFAFWDSFRTKYPLYSLFIPHVYGDIVTSLRDLYQQADNWGSLPGSDHRPHGPGFKAAGKDGYQIFASCRHEHMLMVVADAYFKQLMKTDIRSLYPFMKREVMLQMPEKYDSIGFIPARPDQTGEYCWDNWVLAQVAKSIGNDQDYSYLMKRSEYWRNTWDTSIKFFRARSADGTWLDFPENPAVNREKYTYEGTKWQWRWNVIHDLSSLTEAFCGSENFVKKLEYFFDNDLYTAGNQIDLQAPYLFNMAGSPWLTQKWVRKLLTGPVVQKYGTHDFFKKPVFDRIYKATPDGFLEEMDDDYGCMSAWYAMSAIGFYEVCPGNPIYQVTAPVFDKVIINPDNSIQKKNQFTIKAENLSNENIYIQSATLNGKPFNRSNIRHDEIRDGGELIFIMGNKPNKNWGI